MSKLAADCGCICFWAAEESEEEAQPDERGDIDERRFVELVVEKMAAAASSSSSSASELSLGGPIEAQPLCMALK